MITRQYRLVRSDALVRLAYWWKFGPVRGSVLRWLAATLLIYTVHFGLFPPSARVSLKTAVVLTVVLAPVAIWNQARRIKGELGEGEDDERASGVSRFPEGGREWRTDNPR